MQLMHNFGDLRHALQRQEWLQLQLHNMYTASMSTPQESTPKVAENRQQKPLKKENRPKHFSQQNQHINPKKSHRHNVKLNVDKVLKPDIP
ncbi:Hypothetical predicted protein [Pelobates cultripes]|uniref:Parathyroid hormone n=2 Tax=Pelobates TaxID=61615 RepID=A0AAD1TGE2_PELCU|nr:Hypothetical predicted protein [Pelobates cultripes]